MTGAVGAGERIRPLHPTDAYPAEDLAPPLSRLQRFAQPHISRLIGPARSPTLTPAPARGNPNEVPPPAVGPAASASPPWGRSPLLFHREYDRPCAEVMINWWSRPPRTNCHQHGDGEASRPDDPVLRAGAGGSGDQPRSRLSDSRGNANERSTTRGRPLPPGREAGGRCPAIHARALP